MIFLHYIHKVGSIIITIKFVLKDNDATDKDIKLMGIASCEEKIPKFTTHFYKRQIKSAMNTMSKQRLISTIAKRFV